MMTSFYVIKEIQHASTAMRRGERRQKCPVCSRSAGSTERSNRVSLKPAMAALVGSENVG
jgi:hypothetical protein